MRRFQVSRSRRRVFAALIGVIMAGAALGIYASISQPLSSHLLSVDQVPAGWSVYAETGNGPGCLGTAIKPTGISRTASAAIGFEYNGDIPALVERLATYSDATTAYRKIASALTACKVLSGLSGQTSPGTVGRMNLPHFGDVSEAFRANFVVGEVQLGEDLLIVRKGNTIMAIDEGGLAPVNASQFQGFAKKALAKLP
jgi:ABC-type sugar transport system substrate-binding protein